MADMQRRKKTAYTSRTQMAKSQLHLVLRTVCMLAIVSSSLVDADCILGNQVGPVSRHTTGGQYIDLLHPVQCSGDLIAWHFCYYSEDITQSGMHIVFFRVWRPANENNLDRVYEHTQEMDLDPSADGFVCVDVPLDPDNYFEVVENDRLAVYIARTNTLGRPLHIISSGTTGFGLFRDNRDGGFVSFSSEVVATTDLQEMLDLGLHLYADIETLPGSSQTITPSKSLTVSTSDQSAGTNAPVPTSDQSAGTDTPVPTGDPSAGTDAPVGIPTGNPSAGTDTPVPTGNPSAGTDTPVPTGDPSAGTDAPVGIPTGNPSAGTDAPVGIPTGDPSAGTDAPVGIPTGDPSAGTDAPVGIPTGNPSAGTDAPVGIPTGNQSPGPTPSQSVGRNTTSGGSDGLSGGAIAAIVIVLLLLVAVCVATLMVVGILMYRRRRRQKPLAKTGFESSTFSIDNAVYEFPTRAADYEIPTNSKSYDDDQLQAYPEHPAEENLYVFVDGQPQEGRISIYADPDTQQLYNHDAYEQGPMKNHNWKYDTWGDSTVFDIYASFGPSNSEYWKLMEDATKDYEVTDAVDQYQAPPAEEERIYEEFSKQQIREIPRDAIEIMAHLGSGQFAKVDKGVWKSTAGVLEVAVKTLNHEASEMDKVKFLQEAAIMGQFRHPNAVRLYGVVTEGSCLMLVAEYLSKGDLRCWLLDRKPGPGELIAANTAQLLLSFSQQVALGMHYLANKGFVHRDLAARNVFVSKDNICKIGDFGMSRDLADDNYYVSHGGMVPVRWTAPEAVNYRKYSAASDVWSYGCLLYEIFAIGCKPFKSFSNTDVLKLVGEGYRLPPPPGCPRVIYETMIQSWHPVSSSRPSFRDILAALLEGEEKVLEIPMDDASTNEYASVLGSHIQAGEAMYPDLQQSYLSTASINAGEEGTFISPSHNSPAQKQNNKPSIRKSVEYEDIDREEQSPTINAGEEGAFIPPSHNSPAQKQNNKPSIRKSVDYEDIDREDQSPTTNGEAECLYDDATSIRQSIAASQSVDNREDNVDQPTINEEAEAVYDDVTSIRQSTASQHYEFQFKPNGTEASVHPNDIDYEDIDDKANVISTDVVYEYIDDKATVNATDVDYEDIDHKATKNDRTFDQMNENGAIDVDYEDIDM